MDFPINWAFLTGIIIVGSGPIILQKNGVKIFFDSKLFGVSQPLSLFIALQSICLYVCLASRYQKAASQPSRQDSNYLFFLILTGFIYCLLRILFSKSFDEKSALEKHEELDLLKHVISLEKELSNDKKLRVKKLSIYFYKLKILLTLSIIFYILFFFFLASALVDAHYF